MSLCIAESVTDTVGDAVSAQADELTVVEEDVEEQEPEEINVDRSETIEANTYNIKPLLQDKFKAMCVRQVIQDILSEELAGKVYSAEEAKHWSINIANNVNRRVKDMKWKRYKHIVQVILGEQKGAGINVGLKCVWDVETDNFASDFFTNETIFCVVTVYACYFY